MQRPLRCLLLLLLLASVFAASTASATPQERVWTMGAFNDNYPYSFVNEQGEHDGFATDLTKALERTMNLRFNRVVGTTAEINTAMSAGMLDMIMTLAESEERRTMYDFSHPYLPLINSIIVRKGNASIRSISDLKGKLVLVHHNSLGEAFLLEHGLRDSIIYSTSVEQCLRDLDNGRGDAVIATRLTAISTVIRLGLDNIDRTGVPLPDMRVNYCYAIRKGNPDLAHTLDEGLAILHNNGEFDRIYQKWFGQIERGRYTREEIIGAIAAGLAIALAVCLWAFLRQRRLKSALSLKAAQLSASEDRYHSLFESSQQGLILLNQPPLLLVVETNPAARRILRLAEPPAPDTPLGKLLPPRIAERLCDAIHTAINPENSPRFDLDLAFQDGTTWVSGTLSRVGTGFLLVLGDITDAHTAREQLQKSEHQLRQTQKLEAIGTLASGIAHDFNNILTGIIGNTELAQFELPPDHPASSCLTEVLKSSTRARELTRQILTFSRRTHSRREVTSVTPVVAEAVNFIRATAPASIQIRHLAPDKMPEVEADATQLHQVVMNLCTNALHAMRGGNGQLEVSEDVVDVTPDMISVHPQLREGRHVRISVRDTGCGMPQHVLQRIFEPFFTTKPPGEGTGLGLSVVHGIIEDHRGAITVYSQPGQGTVFRIHIPVTSAAQPLPPAGAVREIPRGDGERIIFVDDEPAIVRIVESMLRRLGYSPLCFTRAQEAAAAFSENPGAFNILITDFTMPQLNGIELARRMRDLRPDLPVVLASGYIGEKENEAARERGIHTILQKPISLLLLAEAVREELRRARDGGKPPPGRGR